MERKGRVVESPEIEAKKLFDHVVKYEHNHLLNFFDDKFIPSSKSITENKYLNILREEYIKLFIDRAEMVIRRKKKFILNI